MPSADGKGRSLLDILTGRNQKDMRPLEFQYHNPLEAKVGCTVCFDHEEEIRGINFVIEKISVYKTEIGRETFFHTDYHLKGTSLDTDGYVRLWLRLIPDDNVTNKLGHRIQLLQLYEEMQWDEDLYNMLCENGDYNPDYDDEGTRSFKVNYDDEGNELEHPRMYWRIGTEMPQQDLDPYHAKLTVLSDVDGDGTIEDHELEHFPVTYWEFSRMTDNPETEEKFEEFLTVDMDDGTRFFRFLRGTNVLPFQVTVI